VPLKRTRKGNIMPFSHAVVWIDHSEAHVLHFNDEAAETEKIRSRSKHQHQHRKSGAPGSGHAPDDQAFYHEVAHALADAREILVVGPAGAKLGLLKHMQKHDPAVADKVVGIESIDHPSDGQLLAHARHYFVKADRMLGDPMSRAA
jgi:stalled ribosome rescue protein Dom34